MKTLSANELTMMREAAIKAMAAIVVDANVECARMNEEEGEVIDITTYGVDEETVGMYVKDFIPEVAEMVKKIQSQ